MQRYRQDGIIGTVMHRYDGKTKYDNISKKEDNLFKQNEEHSLKTCHPFIIVDLYTNQILGDFHIFIVHEDADE